MEANSLEAVEDGSGSPESVDDDMNDPQMSEEQALSKNRSKRKPSKTQIKHIAPPNLNGQAHAHRDPNYEHSCSHSGHRHRRTASENANGIGNRDGNCDTSKYGTQNMEDLFNDVTQGIFRDSHAQPSNENENQEAQVQPAKSPRRARKSASTFQTPPSHPPRTGSSRPSPCYPCGICGKIFRVPSRYESHMLGHSKGKPYCCNTCGKMFSSQEKLDRHLPVHNCDRNAAFTCEACGKICVNWRAYLYHIKAKHTEAGGKRFTCNLCGRQFYTGHRLRKHMASHEVGKNHCCHVCGKLFESGKKLEVHSLVHSLESLHDQHLQCLDCGRQFTEWIAFKQHMKTHGTEGIHYPCGICGQTFPTQYEKEKHKRIHKQVQCDYCLKYFRSASVLSVHMRVHTGEKPYKCGLCDNEFSLSSVLKSHVRTHANMGSYVCNVCSATFNQVSDYFNHYIKHFEEGNLKCDVCNKSFGSVQKKNRHMASHGDKSLRSCPLCCKQFSRISHLEAHMLCHSDQLPLMCKICGKMFSSDDLLSVHYSTHLPGDISAASPEEENEVDELTNENVFSFSQVKLNHHSPAQKADRNASHTCENCGKVCVNWRAYIYHLRSRHSETGAKKFSCTVSLCGRQFHTRHRLRNHMLSHEKGKHHCCQVCGKLFESNKKLDIHSLVHNLTSMHDQHLQCADCGRQYTEWIAFKQHMKTHGAEGVQYSCALCEEIFPTQYEMEKHKRVHKQFQCEFCDRFFRSASVLSVHLRVHTGERPYKCGLCERDFSQSSVLKVHMRTHSKDGRYECKLCNGVFPDVMVYFRHHMAHLEEGNLQCEECGKLFQNINNKNRHMAAHRDRSGRQCHVCGKEFGRVSHLEAHMLCHSDQLPLMCKVCGKMFSSQEVLTAHYSTHMTGDISSDTALLNEGPYFCNICGKMFKDQAYLDNHMKKHEKEGVDTKPGERILDEDIVEVEKGQFACGDCGKAFGKAHHLTVHRREHTGERPHSCCMCGQSFMLRTQLLQHIREHRRSGLMMYLNLNAGQVCTTTDQKNEPADASGNAGGESDSGSETETDCDHEENVRIARHVTTTTNTNNPPPPPLQIQQQPNYVERSSSAMSNPTPNTYTNSNHQEPSSNHHSSPAPHDVHHRMLPPSRMHRHVYNDAMSPPPTTNLHAHQIEPLTMKDERYLYRDLHMPRNELMLPTMHLPVNVKNETNVHMSMQMLRPEPHMSTAMLMSTQQEFKTEMNPHFSLPYPKAYMGPPSMTSVPPHRNPIQHNFHGAQGRYPPELHHSLSNFQLLPQTAFPDNSHH